MTAVAVEATCAGTFELVERSITVGDGTDYAFDGAVSGLGIPDIRNNDVDKGHGDGAVGQHDFYAVRNILIPVSIAPSPNESYSDRVTLWGRWVTLRTAWVKSNIDLTLEHTEVGNTDTYFGRPNGVALDDVAWRAGKPLLRVALAFRCPDPTVY